MIFDYLGNDTFNVHFDSGKTVNLTQSEMDEIALDNPNAKKLIEKLENSINKKVAQLENTKHSRTEIIRDNKKLNEHCLELEKEVCELKETIRLLEKD